MDVVYLSSPCSERNKMEKRNTGKIFRCEFLGWYLHHGDNYFQNHDGTAAVNVPFVLFACNRSKSTHVFTVFM